MSERSVEIPWILVHAAKGPTLDVGHVESSYLGDLPRPVDGIDVRDSDNPALRKQFVGDIRAFRFPEPYPTVLAISTIEHVGLAVESYGTSADDEKGGDRKALLACARATARGGRLLVTVPFGRSGDHGWFRQYDTERLEALFRGLRFRYEVWMRAESWIPCKPADAEEQEYDFDGDSARAVALVKVKV